MKLVRPFALAATLVTFVGCAASQRWEPPEAAPAPLGVFVAESDVTPYAPGMIRARAVQDPAVDLWAGARTPDGDSSAVAVVHLNLFEDADVEARLTRVRTDGASRVWEGELFGHPGSIARLAQRGGQLAGSVELDGRRFTIGPHEGRTVIAEWDEAAIPEDAPAVVPARLAPPVAIVDRAGDGSGATGPAEVDVLVVYTGEAAERAGGDDSLDATIDLAVAEANASLVDSGVAGRFHLVGSHRVLYDETAFDFETTLTRLSVPGDGFLDDVQALRDAAGADHVVLIVDHVGPYAGIGYQMTSATAPFFASAAYSVVARDYAAGFYTFAHELGHNLGANHDHANAADGFYPDSHGHQALAEGFRTVMAYSCADGPCPRVGAWSNPARTYRGAPTGVVGVSDNVRTLDETMRLAAEFRARPEAPTVVAARIVEPTGDADRLHPGEVWFRWEDLGADAYYLMVGSFPGDHAYHRASAGRATGVRVDHLPQDGSAVHARLWTLWGTEWVFSDHEFVAAQGPYQGAHVNLPAPNTTLGSTWTWFGWEPVAGAVTYRLEVGTDAEPGRYFDREVGLDRAAQVPGLPADGTDVVVRLSTRSPDGWRDTEARFVAWEAPHYASRIVSPPHGATLGRNGVTFRWVDSGAPYYWLLLVDDAGAVHVMEAVVGTEVTVTPPSGHGRLTALLYAYGSDGWVATSAAYAAP